VEWERQDERGWRNDEGRKKRRDCEAREREREREN